MSIIQAKDVKKWFGDFQALKGISMEVAEGEVLVICGPSGSGKSTFIRCINRLEQHQEGEIIVDGIELTNDLKNIEAIRSHGRVWKYKGEAFVEGKKMADAQWSATIVDRK